MLRIPQPVLSDGIVTLRPPEERDLETIERGVHDPDVIRAFGRLNRDRCHRGEAPTFAICDDADCCLGHVFVNLTSQARGNVGYWLLPEARGKGLATRAVRLLSRWALRKLRLARLGLLAEPSNPASLRVAERSGFRREGVHRSYGDIDGRRVDYVCFSHLPSDLARHG